MWMAQSTSFLLRIHNFFMAHHTYRTDGIVLSGMDAGEGSRYLGLLTEELGFIEAHCASVREMRSRMRFHTQPYTLATFGLVRGKEVWRLTNALEIQSAAAFRDTPNGRGAVARVSTLVRRLLHGEEPNRALFSAMRNMLLYLADPTISEKEARRVECITLLRSLSSLGYLGESDSFAHFIAEPLFNPQLLAAFAEQEREAVVAINRSLKETQL